MLLKFADLVYFSMISESLELAFKKLIQFCLFFED